MIEDIAERVASFSLDDLSRAARERLTLCLLANISVGVAGVPYCVLPEPAAPEGRYRLLAGSRAADARSAAFWNAAVMHARTQDDFHPVGNLHIGTVVLPAIMAVADEGAMSGRDFLEALAVGYMVAVGLSRSFSPKTTPRGLRSTAIYAPFGAAAAVARARGCSTAEIGHALAFTTVFAGGTTQAWIDGSDEWQLHPAHGAETGLRTVELARAGLRGGAHALDGSSGFYRALVGEEVSFEAIASDFDASRAIEENAIKRYPVSGICQSVVLACERLAPRLGDRSAISAVRVQMNPFEMRYPGTLNRGPRFRSFGERLMSATFCTASVLAHGRLEFSDFHAGANETRDRLIGVVEISESPDLPLLSSQVSVTLANGDTLTERVIDSRGEVGIDWESIDVWGSELWREAGRSAEEFRACRTAVRDLDRQAAATGLLGRLGL